MTVPKQAPLLHLLLARLERISADSPLAHRASGVRGALLRTLEDQNKGIAVDAAQLDAATDAALEILRRAAALLRATPPKQGSRPNQ